MYSIQEVIACAIIVEYQATHERDVTLESRTKQTASKEQYTPTGDKYFQGIK